MSFKFLQVATLWAQVSGDEFNEITYAAPTQVKVRWENKTEMMVDDQGKERRSKALIFSEEEMENRDFLFLGVSALSSPQEEDLAFQIFRKDVTPSLSNTRSLKKYWLEDVTTG